MHRVLAILATFPLVFLAAPANAVPPFYSSATVDFRNETKVTGSECGDYAKNGACYSYTLFVSVYGWFAGGLPGPTHVGVIAVVPDQSPRENFQQNSCDGIAGIDKECTAPPVFLLNAYGKPGERLCAYAWSWVSWLGRSGTGVGPVGIAFGGVHQYDDFDQELCKDVPDNEADASLAVTGPPLSPIFNLADAHTCSCHSGWTLEFGDGTTQTGTALPASVSHTYAPGSYVATLRVHMADSPDSVETVTWVA